MKLKWPQKIHKNREEFFWLARIYTPALPWYLNFDASQTQLGELPEEFRLLLSVRLEAGEQLDTEAGPLAEHVEHLVDLERQVLGRQHNQRSNLHITKYSSKNGSITLHHKLIRI